MAYIQHNKAAARTVKADPTTAEAADLMGVEVGALTGAATGVATGAATGAATGSATGSRIIKFRKKVENRNCI
jgi:hypothetical protein